MGTGGDAYPVEITLGLIDRGETVKDRNGMLRTDEDAGTRTTAFLEINDDLAHTRTFLEAELQFFAWCPASAGSVARRRR